MMLPLQTKRNIFLIAAALGLALALYFFCWPVPMDAVSWRAPENLGYTAHHAPNHQLAALQTHPLPSSGRGAEHIIVHRNALYTGVDNGDILRIDASTEAGPARISVIANTGGRPLGLVSSPDGQLIIADAIRGLLAINTNNTATNTHKNNDNSAAPFSVQTILGPSPQSQIPNTSAFFADAPALDAQNGIWLTDASTRFIPHPPEQSTMDASLLDTLEHSCSARLLYISPTRNRVQTALSGICFANGLISSRDHSKLLMVETGLFRVIEIDIAKLQRALQDTPHAPLALSAALENGVARVWVDNLPGYPDNINQGENGRIWIGLVSPRSRMADATAQLPILREIMLRTPKSTWPIPPHYGHIVAMDSSGRRVVDDLQNPQGSYPETTGAVEFQGKLWVQSLSANSLASIVYPPIAP